MRRHGWGGRLPSTDDEAVERIVATARELIVEQPDVPPSISEVAERLSITRQTVYRYVPSARALLAGAVQLGVDDFLDAVSSHLRGITDPAGAIAELIAFAHEELRRRPDLALLLSTGGTSPTDFTSEVAMSLNRAMLDQLDVDWSAYESIDLDELTEVVLRWLLSFVFSPGERPRTTQEIRAFVRRWLGPALAAGAPGDHTDPVPTPRRRRRTTTTRRIPS